MRNKGLQRVFFVVILSTAVWGCSAPSKKEETKKETASKPVSPAKMVLVPGSQFYMGASKQSSTNDAQPFHKVAVDSFWMDETEVTNAQYAAFTEATGYETVAERPILWEELKKSVAPGTPKPPDEQLQPGSLVFTPPAHPVKLNDYSQWWTWIIGANWRHPSGPASSIEGLENCPVVQLAYEDAEAYAKWAGKRLPTEAEFECAARGGKQQKEYAWGDELNPQGSFMANYFQGAFPYKNIVQDGFEGTAPVKSFPPNEFGLFDLIGNVWELCSDFYEVADFEKPCPVETQQNPKGPSATRDPNDPYAIKRVSKGGSFLCSFDYCSNYKPSGRQGSAYDTGMNHTGFRCVKDIR